MNDKDKGLYEKFTVIRNEDPLGKHHECHYFVLDLDHDKFAKAALITYADLCRHDFPELAKDIREWIVNAR